MKRFIVSVLIGFSFFCPLQAVLPPLYQTANEIKAILASEELGTHLSSGEVIVKIEKQENGYEITTNYNHLLVSITYEPVNRPGPAQFTLKFQKTQPLNK